MAKKIIKKSITDKKQKDKKSLDKEVFHFLRVLFNAIIFVLILNGVAIASFVVPTGSMEDEVEPGDFLFVNRFIYGPTSPQVIPLVNIELPYIKIPGIWTPENGDVIVFEYPGPPNVIKNEPFTYYLKRCWGTPGDTLQIIDKKVYINGELQEDPEHVRFDDGTPFDAQVPFPPGKNWTLDNYGPLYIPKKGDILKLEFDANFIDTWGMFIMREGHSFTFDSRAKKLIIDGKEATEYVIERDYCFGMGDNRHNSSDSRFWGFIPQEKIVGTPMMVYWNIDPEVPFTDNGKFSIIQLFRKIGSSDLSRVGNIIN